MTETRIEGVLESLDWKFGSGLCSLSITGQPREFHGDQRLVRNFLEEQNVSIGDSVIMTVNEIDMILDIRRADDV